MQVLIEKEFYVTESHVIIHDDHPVMGASQAEVLKHVTHGPFKTTEEVKTKIDELMSQYSTIRRIRTDDWTSVVDEIRASEIAGNKITLLRKTSHSVEGPEIDPRAGEIRFRVREKVLGEKPFP